MTRRKVSKIILENKKLKNENMELAAKITELTERNRELAQFKEEHDKQSTEIQNGDFGALDKREVNQITEIPVVETIPSYTATDVDAKQYIAGGMSGIVRKGWDKNHRPVAVKTFFQLDKHAANEIAVLATLSHPNIIELFGVLSDDSTAITRFGLLNLIYSGYVMEYMEGGTLYAEIHDPSKTYGMLLTCIWIEQIGQGLQYLHGKGIIHGDVKPQNILFASRTCLKLADFGSAANFSAEGNNFPGPGTDPYRAPEISKKYGPPADVYSLGITIWELVHRKHAHEHIKYSKDRDGNICVELPIDLSKMDKELSHLVQSSWSYSPSESPSVSVIISFTEAILLRPFIKIFKFFYVSFFEIVQQLIWIPSSPRSITQKMSRERKPKPTKLQAPKVPKGRHNSSRAKFQRRNR